MLTLVLITTLGAWFGFANPLFHFPLAVLAFPLGLSWIGLRATSGKKAFKFGWFSGVLAATGCYYWMVIPVQVYGGLPWYIALPCPFLLACFMSLYFGLFSLGMYHAGQRINGVPLCLLAGLSWATMEMLMGSVFTGFPWVNLSSAFAPWPLVIQGASVVGAYGLSGILTALAVALLLCTTYRSSLVLALTLAIALTGFGYYRMATLDLGDEDYTMSLIQGNVDQSKKWDPEYQVETVKKYARLTMEAAAEHHPKVAVWPETAMPFFLQDPTPLRSALEKMAHDSDLNIIMGSPAYHVTDMKSSSYVLYNRAWLMDSTGRTTQHYDKEHLVPFGEYMPLEKWMPFDKLVQAAGNFKPGVDNKPLQLNGVALGMLICYEAIFPELAQQQVERGASVLVNISNDAWFGDTSAPRQHLNLAIMRAVEQNRWLARDTNTGITVFADPLGRIRAMSEQFKANSLTFDVAPRSEKTIFHQLYATITYVIFGLTIIGYGAVLFTSRRKGNRL